MKKCWDEDSLKKPNISEIADTISNWISIIINRNINEISKNIAIEFYKVDKVLEQKQKQTNTYDIINNKSHPQVYHTSRLLNFTKNLNKILNQEEKEKTNYLECLDQKKETNLLLQTEGMDCIIADLKQLGIYKKEI